MTSLLRRFFVYRCKQVVFSCGFQVIWPYTWRTFIDVRENCATFLDHRVHGNSGH